MSEDFTIPSDIMPISTMEREPLTSSLRQTMSIRGGNPSMSVIIQSLLDLLLSCYEQNDARRSKLLELMWESMIKVFPCSNSVNSPAFMQLRGQYQMVFKKLIKISQKKLGYSSALSLDIKLDSDYTHLSRYRSEFEEIEYLAKGGFGSVFRVRNKLDHFEYAIKKILLKCDKDWTHFTEVTKEVIMLAKLTHPNIVNYKTAWIEPTSIIESSVPKESHSESESFLSDFTFSISDKSTTNTSQSILFEENSQSNQMNKVIQINHQSSQKILPFSTDNESNSYTDNQPVSSNTKSLQSTSLLPSSCLKMGAILYLQMELCEITLRGWMDNRASSSLSVLDSKVNTQIFTQILEGVSYIHSQGIIHRDLKPRNIFIRNRDCHVQIGDFGLAKDEIQKKVVPPESPLENNIIKFKKVSSCVGTHAYASPEQLSLGWVDYKSDIYSLGIVLYELFSNFKTGMERSVAITNLKENLVIDTVFERKFPQIAQYVLWLTRSSPHSRPTAQELLNSEFSKEGQLRLSLLTENIILKESLDEKNKELETYKNIIASRNREIELLTEKLMSM
ncbi:eukaryotic translation initiation factor 2-alpha kinase 1 isoform X1 [Lepeophtheirus salmonis]|uniref:eukaryotic translation initiation factor 2-alpha kinase 1 isoform X1 n=2 Tax=Lepeophtheirus salmonis TaxID=72036 RepID=UPI001AE790B3|nr:eukaryotic translation initiation factor 2-alpha kinase 3-like isoform X1 [Lepeophtheirus salmonis]